MNRIVKALTIFLVVAFPVAAVCASEKGSAEKASSAKVYKISELFQHKATLDKQQVTVKGKVIKVSAGIMHRNWVHLQDGSGDPAKKNNDLTVTTKDELPEIGKVVTATGILHKDKDFGAGYFYPVIIEEASIKH